MRNLIFKDQKKEEVVKKPPSFFSEPPSTPPVSITPTSKVLETYEKEFEKINTPGIDFYEFFTGVRKAGINKTNIDMMYMMVNGSNPTLDRSMLVLQANGAIEIMNEFLKEANQKAQIKKESIVNQTTVRKKDLELERQHLISELARIQGRLSEVESTLISINDNSEIKSIDETLHQLTQVHSDNVSKIKSVIELLNAGL